MEPISSHDENPLKLNEEEFKALKQVAAAKRRTPEMQAAVFVVQALGLMQDSEPATPATGKGKRVR